MKNHFITALVAVSLLATLNSCSKEEQIDVKTVTTSSNPLDPYNFGYIDRGEGELYYYRDKVTSYSQANKNYLLLKSLSLEKYKNGELLDSVCNKDIAFRFENKGRKSHNKSAQWGTKPEVAEEHPPIITVNTDWSFTIKLSKMVSAIGFEINSPYKGVKYGITVRYFNTELNKVIPPTYTSYLYPPSDIGPQFGQPGSAMLRSIDSETPFNEIRITYEYLKYGEPAPPGTFDLLLAGFRYRLAK